MKAVYDKAHWQRHPTTELDGGQLVTPYESPERAEYVKSSVTESGIAQPSMLSRA